MRFNHMLRLTLIVQSTLALNQESFGLNDYQLFVQVNLPKIRNALLIDQTEAMRLTAQAWREYKQSVSFAKKSKTTSTSKKVTVHLTLSME